MKENLFDNMIKVLVYFADQCDMFVPMLDGVKDLKAENDKLRQEVNVTRTITNRLQLDSMFKADYANFDLQTVKTLSDETKTIKTEKDKNLQKNINNDLYILIKSVISVGRDNYIREDMEYKLDCYSLWGMLDFDLYMELFELIEEQHKDIVEEPPVVTPPS